MREPVLDGPERVLWDVFPRGGLIDFRPAGASAGGPEAEWGPDRVIRAEVIAGLLLGARETAPGQVPAVRVNGARVTGVLDLAFADVAFAVLLTDCRFDRPPRLPGARLRRISLAGSRLPGLDMAEARVDGQLILERCRFDGTVDVTGCVVTETLSLRDAQLAARPALAGESLTVGRNVICTGMRAHGECVLSGARIGGSATFTGAHLDGGGGKALAAQGLSAERGAYLDGGFRADGEVQLQDARIGRKLMMAGATVRNPGGTGLQAERIAVDGAACLDEGFTCLGQVILRGGVISGDLQLGGAEMANPGGVALAANRLSVDSGVFARGGFTARGEVQLSGALIRGWLNLHGAQLLNRGGVALHGEGMAVSGRLFCGENMPDPGGTSFRAEGELILTDARIDGGLFLDAATLSNPGGRSLTAAGLTTSAAVTCSAGMSSDGGVSFAGARIGGQISFETATILGDLSLPQLQATALRVNAQTRVEGTFDLRHATVEVLADEPDLPAGSLRLRGFTYTAIQTQAAVATRLKWLARDGQGYDPQPYEQLAATYRAADNDADARAVLYARQIARKRTLPALRRAWGTLQDLTFGYGYRPLRAALWFATLLTAGTIAFGLHHPPPIGPGPAPEFNAFLYTLDLLVPIGGFGLKGSFGPHGWQQWLAAGLIAAGWLLATTIATGISRTLSRQ